MTNQSFWWLFRVFHFTQPDFISRAAFQFCFVARQFLGATR